MDFDLGVLFKKTVSEEKVATLFVNNVLNSVDTSFTGVADLINNDLQFESPADIGPEDQDAFLMIVITGNLLAINDYFGDEQGDRIKYIIEEKLAAVYEVTPEEFATALDGTIKFFEKVNFPSKKTLYAMSKSVFHRYDLNRFQKTFFKEKKVPDPVFLKHVDEIMGQFLIDWNKFTHKFRVTD
jgi:hypothetical protein